MTKLFIPRLRFTLLLMACLLAVTVGNSRAAPPVFSWVDCGDEKLWLQEQGETVMMFQLKARSLDGRYARADYLHPLYGPDGAVVTEDFPADHRHHRGIFWAWHQLLLSGKSVADPWMCQDIQWKAPEELGDWVKTRADGQSAQMTVVRDWVVPHPERNDESLRLVRETASITVWPSAQSLRILDFDLRFRALVGGVAIGGSDDEKGYGGFSPRIRLAEDVKFVSQKGMVTPHPLAAVEGGAWIDVVGTLDGVRKGVAMMVHPSHPGFPRKWILRPKASMQNLQWPGPEPVGLSTQLDTRLRYRLALHTGELDRETLESIWQDFAKNAD